MSANDKQVDGNHYRETEIQHWDFAASQKLDYFQGQITKYVCRWKKKNGIVDLEKAHHFLEKYLELEKKKIAVTGTSTKKFELGLFPKSAPGLRDLLHNKPTSSGMYMPFGFNPEED